MKKLKRKTNHLPKQILSIIVITIVATAIYFFYAEPESQFSKNLFSKKDPLLSPETQTTQEPTTQPGPTTQPTTHNVLSWNHGQPSNFHFGSTFIGPTRHTNPSAVHQIQTILHNDPTNQHITTTTFHTVYSTHHTDPSNLDPPGGPTHGFDSFTHNVQSFNHNSQTDTHKNPTITHASGTTTHSRDSSGHLTNSELHTALTQPGHGLGSATHTLNTVFHDITTTTHSTNSDTHAQNSNTHKQNTDVHKQNTEWCYPPNKGGTFCSATLLPATYNTLDSFFENHKISENEETSPYDQD